MVGNSGKYSCATLHDWVLVIGTLPINGHQNAWRAVKDLLKRLLAAIGVSVKEHIAAKIQQVHIVETPNGRYAVCRFGHSLQARNAFDWIGGNVWHGARIGAWLYRVGSDWHSSAVQVDSWDRYRVLKNTPLEAFWAIGNAFLQRSPTAGPISPVSGSPSPMHLQPDTPTSPTTTISSTSETTCWDDSWSQRSRWRCDCIANGRDRNQHARSQTFELCECLGTKHIYSTSIVQAPGPVVICNGSDEDVPVTTYGRGREVLVG